MKKLVHLILLFLPLGAITAQNSQSSYAWEWATLNYTCPGQVPNFPTELDFSNGPKRMAIDSLGNVFLLGFMEVPQGLDYTLGANTGNPATYTQNNPYTTNTNTALYFMKLNARGELLWSKNIATAGIWAGMDLELHVDAQSSISHILFPSGSEIKLNHDFIHAPDQWYSCMLSFNSNGDLIDTIWHISSLIPGDSGSYLYTKPGPWPNQFDVVRRNAQGEKVLQTFNYNVPKLIYNPFRNKYVSLRAGSTVMQIFDTDLKFERNVQLSGDLPDMLGTDFKVTFGHEGQFMITYYDQSVYAHWLLLVDSNYQSRWYRKAGSVSAFDSDGNPWTYYPTVSSIDDEHIVPFRGESCVAIMLDRQNGNLTGDFVAPTYTSYCRGANDFFIDHQNRFFMAGSFRYEIEFGRTILRQICSNKAFGKTQFVAMARPGKDSTRFTAEIADLNSGSNALVYPNPFSDNLFIRTKERMEEVHIQDLRGNAVIRISPQSNYATLDLRSLKPGIYVVQIVSDDRSSYRRIVKQ